MIKRILAILLVCLSIIGATCSGYANNAVQITDKDIQNEASENSINASDTVSDTIRKKEDCTDFSKCLSHSDALFAYVVPQEDYYAFDDDYTMFRRSTNTKEWLVYETDGVEYPIFNTYFKYTQDIWHFEFEVSEDNKTWQTITPDIKVTEVEDWKWIPVTYSLKNADKNIRYVKVIYSDKAEYEWTPMIASVEFKSDYKGAGFGDCVDTKYQSAVGALNALGFINGKEENRFKPYDNLSRAELAKITARLLNLPQSDNKNKKQIFTDVDTDYWASTEIDFLYNIGIINGDTDKKFYPEEDISYIDTAKILLCAMGYLAESEKSGGYPEGYRAVARRLKLFDNIEISDVSQKINRGDCAVMIKNAIDTPIVHNVVYGTNPEFKKDGQTILSVYHNINKIEGLVSACDGMSIVSEKNCAKGEIIVDDIKYNCISDKVTPSAEAINLLGREVVGYTDAKDNLLYADAEKGYVIDLVAYNKAYINTNAKKLYYEDGGDKEKYCSLSSNTRIVYNGRYKTRVGVIKETELDIIGSENIRLILNDDKCVDCILVWDYINYIAAGDGNFKKGITSKNNGNLKLDFDNADYVNIKINGEEATDSGEIQKGDVISAAVSEDGGVITVAADKRRVYGTVSYVSDNTDDKKIKLDNRYYNLTPDYMSLGKKLSPGAEVTVYLDINGDVFASEAIGESEYAYLCAIGSADVFGSEVVVKLLRQDGKIDDYVADERTLYNGSKSKIDKICDISPGLVAVRIKENRILSVDTAAENIGSTDTAEFSLSFMSDYCKYYSGSLCVFSSIYQLGANTPVFIIPKETKDYDSYRVGDRYSIFSDFEYKVKLYDLSDEYTVGAAVIYMDSSRERVVQSYDNMAIVKDCSVINNAKGEACLKLDVFQNGEETSVYFDNYGGEDMTNNWLPDYSNRVTAKGNAIFKGGEVIQQYSDHEAHCKSFRMFLTEDMIKNKVIYENNIKDYGAITKENYFSELYTAFGYVENRFSDKLMVKTSDKNLRTVSLNNARIYKYNSRKSTVETAYASDICVGDYVFVKMSYGDTTDIMVVSQK